MTGDLVALAGLLVAPALLVLGFLAVVGLIVLGLAEAEPAEWRLLSPRSGDPPP